MRYSYFFNEDKSHRIEFAFEVQSHRAQSNGSVEITFIARVTQFIDNVRERSESKTGIFLFDVNNTNHDIDFLRIRIAEQNKWVFQIKNNKDSRQDVIVGLITKATTGNPLGMDVFHDTTSYTAVVKANNLSILEQNYQSPVLTQTLVYTTFNTPEYPIGFSTETGIYDSSKLLYKLRDFNQLLQQPIEPYTSFSVEMNVAPLSVEAKNEKIFVVNVDGVGRFELLRTNLVFVQEGSEYVNAIKIPIGSTITPETFYRNGTYTSASKLTISGNGVGKLTISYLDKQFTVDYVAGQQIQSISLAGQEASIDVSALSVQAGDVDLAAGATVLTSGDRLSLIDEWIGDNAVDGDDNTAWGSIQSGNIDGLAYIGVDLRAAKAIKNITFRQADTEGIEFLNIETSEDGNTWTYVESANTFGQDLVSIDLNVRAVARYWRIVAGSPVVSFPDNGDTWENRMVDQSWTVYNLSMYEAENTTLPAPENLVATVQPDNSVLLTWDYNGPADVYFRVYNQSIYLGVEVTGVNEAILTNLIEDKEYHVQVSAKKDSALSPISNTATFKVTPAPIDWTKRIPVLFDNFIVKFYK